MAAATSTADPPPMLPIILGSSSLWRRRILEGARLAFETLSPGIDEAAIAEADPEKRVLALAHAKADALIARVRRPVLLITSDQVVLFDGVVREKPRSMEEARLFLGSYDETHPAETITAVVVTNTVSGRRFEGIDRATQLFRPLPDTLIEELIGSGEVLSCAGGFRIEDPRVAPYLSCREGSEDSIMGMPIELTLRLLHEAS